MLHYRTFPQQSDLKYILIHLCTLNSVPKGRQKILHHKINILRAGHMWLKAKGKSQVFFQQLLWLDTKHSIPTFPMGSGFAAFLSLYNIYHQFFTISSTSNFQHTRVSNNRVSCLYLQNVMYLSLVSAVPKWKNICLDFLFRK